MEERRIAELIEAAYETGYYASVMEHCKLSKEDREEYVRLHKEALARRKAAKELLEDERYGHTWWEG